MIRPFSPSAISIYSCKPLSCFWRACHRKESKARRTGCEVRRDMLSMSAPSSSGRPALHRNSFSCSTGNGDIEWDVALPIVETDLDVETDHVVEADLIVETWRDHGWPTVLHATWRGRFISPSFSTIEEGLSNWSLQRRRVKGDMPSLILKMRWRFFTNGVSRLNKTLTDRRTGNYIWRNLESHHFCKSPLGFCKSHKTYFSFVICWVISRRFTKTKKVL